MLNSWINKYHLAILLIILTMAIVVRMAYINYAGGSMVHEPDSGGYYAERNFFAGDVMHNFFNLNRTPGYVMATSLIMSVTGQGFPVYKSPQFVERTLILMYLQTTLGIIGIIILYDLLTQVDVSRPLSLVFTAFTAINIYQFMWESAFLTEALFIFLLTVLMRLFVSMLKKPILITGLVFTTISWLAFLVRPAGLGIPFVLLFVVWLNHKTKKVFLLAGALLIMYSLLPLGYSAVNGAINGYRGISFNTDFAIFGRILHYRLPIDAAKSATPDLYTKVSAYIAGDNDTKIPWYFFTSHNDEIYHRLDELQRFNASVVKAQLGEFIGTMIKDIPQAYTDIEVDQVFHYWGTKGSLGRQFFDGLMTISTSLQRGTIIFLALFPLSIILFVQKQTKLHAFIFALGLLNLYQLIATLVFGGPWEFARHMITMQTYLFFFCLWWIISIFSWARLRIKKN